MLLDPESRATAAEALTLPYFTEFREPDEETEAQPYDHSLDNTDLPLSQWKRKDAGGMGFDGWNLSGFLRMQTFISEDWGMRGEHELFY